MSQLSSNQLKGETDLSILLKSMSPTLEETNYVFYTFNDASYGDLSHLNPIFSFQETEGLSLIIPQTKANEHNVAYNNTYKKITLEIHSSLEAVGLTAAFAAKLTEHGLSANVVAGYFHDHIFIRSDVAEEAVSALLELTNDQLTSSI